MWFRTRDVMLSWNLLFEARVIRRATESDVVGRVDPAPVAASSAPRERGRSPRATAIHALLLGTRSRRVDARIAAFAAWRMDRLRERIEHPLCDVAAEPADLIRRAVLRTVVDIDDPAAECSAPALGDARIDHAIAARRLAAPWIRPAGLASRGVLPLGLGRQSLAPRRAVHSCAVPRGQERVRLIS